MHCKIHFPANTVKLWRRGSLKRISFSAKNMPKLLECGRITLTYFIPNLGGSDVTISFQMNDLSTWKF